MLKAHHFLALIIILIISCRKDKLPKVLTNTAYCYSNSSHDTFKIILKDVLNINDDYPWPPTTISKGAFKPSNPVFNIKNSNQIFYIKSDSGKITETYEIWRFDFCTKESKLIADNFKFHLDCSNTGWLLYSGAGNEKYKITTSGDSLTRLTFDGDGYSAGIWSPNGKLFYSYNDNGLKIIDNIGNILFEKIGFLNFKPVEWINNEYILTMNKHDQIYQSYSWKTDELKTLINKPECLDCYKVFDIPNDLIYVVENRHGKQQGLIQFNLRTGQSKQLLKLANSFSFRGGDFNPDKTQLIFTLVRYEWKDSVNHERYVRRDLLLLDNNTHDLRIVELPH